MTPHKALNKLRESGKTLDQIRILLGKKRVAVSVPTLWRIMSKPNHQASYRVSSAIIDLAGAKQLRGQKQ